MKHDIDNLIIGERRSKLQGVIASAQNFMNFGPQTA